MAVKFKFKSTVGRLFMGILLAILAFLLIYVAPPIYYYFYVSLLILISVIEFFLMINNKNQRGYFFITIFFSLLFPAYFYFDFFWAYLSIEKIFAAAIFVLACRAVFKKTSIQERFSRLQNSILPLFFIAFMLSFQINIRLYDGGGITARKLLLFYYIVIIICDTSAYALGTLLGRHQLAPLVSPKKSVEGSIFGLIGGVIGGMLCHFVYLDTLSLPASIFIAFIVCIAAQLGDILESIFKRIAQVKDASNLLIGHGGVLDRADSFILSSAVFYYLILFVPDLL